MAKKTVESRIDETWLEAQITRADGTVEPVKIVAYWHRNPWKRFIHRLKGHK